MSGRQDTPCRVEAGVSRARGDRIARFAGGAALALVVTFMLLPPLLIAVLSFSGDPYLSFPPESWGLRQYETLFSTSQWTDAIETSFRVAVPVALLSVAIAVPAIFAAHRSRLKGRHGILVAGIAGLIVPISAYAIALYGVLSQYGLLGTYEGLVLAHTVLAVPLVLVIGEAAMTRIPIELELAAMTAGAHRIRAWLGITLRVLSPAVLAGGLLAFITSFDEAALINFISGSGQTTLPKAILESARLGIDPVITAIATLLMLATSVLVAGVILLRRTAP